MDRRAPLKRVGVVVPAFGAEHKAKAVVAVDSIKNLVVPEGVEVLWVEASHTNLSEARNWGAEHLISKGAEWLIFLDADDKLDANYIEAAVPFMNEADLIKPATRGFHPDGSVDDEAAMIPSGQSFLVRNHIVIGAPVRSAFFVAAGGFRDLSALEDWDLWIRVILAGGRVVECPGAVYWVGVNATGRNVTANNSTYKKIRDRYLPEWRKKGLA